MKMNRTKIIATLGPSCTNPETLQRMVLKGVNAFRVNLSHGSQEDKKALFDLIKTLDVSQGERPSILADLAGPKIRVTGLDEALELKQDEIIYISSAPTDKRAIPVSNSIKFQKVEEGAKILINDGRVILQVINDVSDSLLECKTIIPGIVEDRKGVNFPGIALDVPTLTDQDEKDLKIALEGGADWVALSFVRSPSDYDIVRSQIRDLGYNTPIIAKVEKWEAVNNIDGIINAFDAVMVARGDLGVELPIERVPLIQKDVIEKASMNGKPVIIATQILDSMIKRPVPTRAEVSDIANAILDGADALMVTGETAIGNHPGKVVSVLRNVILETESAIDYNEFYPIKRHGKINTAKAISHAACTVAIDQDIKVLVTMTHSGSTARMVARYRPHSQIIAMTPSKDICRQLAIVWGVYSFVVPRYEKTDDFPKLVNEVLKEAKLLNVDEQFVITGGVPVGVPGTTNYLSVLKLV
tara:strand:+ start:4818 stop:6230 length:1413 start_codon:yes stop_codon:yes gene_type:complete